MGEVNCNNRKKFSTMSNFTAEIKYTEEDLQIMEDFEDEMIRIHENPLFYEDDMNMDEIEEDLIARTSTLSADAREFYPSRILWRWPRLDGITTLLLPWTTFRTES